MGFSRQEYWSGVPSPSPGMESRFAQILFLNWHTPEETGRTGAQRPSSGSEAWGAGPPAASSFLSFLPTPASCAGPSPLAHALRRRELRSLASPRSPDPSGPASSRRAASSALLNRLTLGGSAALRNCFWKRGHQFNWQNVSWAMVPGEAASGLPVSRVGGYAGARLTRTREAHRPGCVCACGCQPEPADVSGLPGTRECGGRWDDGQDRREQAEPQGLLCLGATEEPDGEAATLDHWAPGGLPPTDSRHREDRPSGPSRHRIQLPLGHGLIARKRKSFPFPLSSLLAL
ncbi:60S ribosomal protein L38 isoform X1 [Bos indicus x Bos taurus]|uniref:60S ribosomal protein L38 isoform X1 n=1 Tax=Bos indicus x Bos taurus TaxID=30522 RepID=UPI000F7D13D0|nr:60S ribosomal protein L38 isoform X1 [Bos indicus x Bos taurus]XP_027374699.1 60S ribosomal protein L38 isoform X1 [Bos indicus x Bos taurus]